MALLQAGSGHDHSRNARLNGASDHLIAIRRELSVLKVNPYVNQFHVCAPCFEVYFVRIEMAKDVDLSNRPSPCYSVLQQRKLSEQASVC